MEARFISNVADLNR